MPSVSQIHVKLMRFQGRALSYKTFFTWLTISVYQGQREENEYKPARN